MSLQDRIDKLGDLSHYDYPDLEPLDQDYRWCHKYAHNVITGKIPACKKMKWAALRHFKDLQRDDLNFDEEAAKSIVLWFKFCPITDGKDAGKPTTLDPSQIFLACSLIGWKWSRTTYDEDGNQVTVSGERRYTQAFMLVSRKYGKTTFAAGIKLYLMYKYGHRPRCFSLATKREQAKEVWQTACEMVRLSPRLKAIFEPRANDMLYPAKSGFFKPLASDSNSLDGLNPMAAILDECHAIKDRNLYGVIISAFGAQTEFLMTVITTAGFILDGLCTDLYKNGARVLDPEDEVEQDNYFYAIFEIDDGDDWSDHNNWYKSNPALVYGRPSMKYLRDRFKEAQLSVAEKGNFITKHCNKFVSGSDKWLDVDEVRACCRDGIDIDDPIYKDRECYIGLDRARVHDINSFAILFPMDDGGIDVFWVNMLPKATIDSVSDFLRAKYMKAVELGHLRIVHSATIRNNDVKKVIRELSDSFNVAAFLYDPWHMREICEDMEEEGYPMVAVSQGTGNMSEPAKQLEGLIKETLLRYDNVLFEYACECAMVSMTRKNNMEIYRENDKVDKIDPLIALIIALSGATLIRLEKNVYEDRGMLSV